VREWTPRDIEGFVRDPLAIQLVCEECSRVPRSLIVRFALFAVALPATTGAAHAQVRDSASVAAIIQRSELYLTAAIVAQDTTALRGALWPQFASVSYDGTLTTQSRFAWISAVKASQVEPLSPRNLVVRVFSRRPPWHRWADLAIASYVADVRTTGAGAQHSEIVFVSDTWRLDGDQWRLIERATSSASRAVAK
jgi:hypothetical protein